MTLGRGRAACTFTLLFVLAHASTLLQFAQYTDYTVAYPFKGLVIPTDGVYVYGMTVSTFYNDCDYGSKWYANNLPNNFVSTYSAYFCSLYITCNTSVQTIGSYGQLLPSVSFYRSVAGSTSGAVLRAGWIMWSSADFQRVIGMSDPAVLMACPTTLPVLPHDTAAAYCGAWMKDSAISDPSSTLAIPENSDNGRLLDNLRRADGRPSNTGSGAATATLKGFVHWIGIYGISTNYDNGASATYTNWAPAEPRGSYPIVMADNQLWYTVSATNSFPFCCQSTGLGSIEQQATGRVNIFMNNAATTTVPTTVMDFDASYSVFSQVTILAASTTPYYGFSVSIHLDDCPTAGMRIVTSGITSYKVNVTRRILLCSITVLAGIPGATFTAGDIAVMLRQLRLVAVSDSVRPSLYKNGTAFRLIYNYLDYPVAAIVGAPTGYPGEGPHTYQCFAKQLQWRDAAINCAAWGNSFGYLATPQSATEQALISRMRGEAATSGDAWIGLNTYFTSAGGASQQRMGNGDMLGYTNWALNEPQLFDAAVVMSSDDGTWRGVFNDRLVNYSSCCERTSQPSLKDAGIINIIPFGSPARGADIVHRSYPTVKGTVFQPFKSLNTQTVTAASTVTTAWGVSVAIQLDVCKDPTALMTWSFVSGSAPTGYVSCPTSATLSPNQQQFCLSKASTLLTTWCSITIVREDKSLQSIAEWIRVLTTLTLTQSYLVEPFQRFDIAWSLWHDTAYGFELLRASDGIASWCSTTQVTFTDAAAGCSSWFEDAYPVSITSADDLAFVTASRSIAAQYATITGNSWIGLMNGATQFLNGDPLTYTNWASNQPDSTGPSVMQADGTWKNVVEYSRGTATLAGYCCKRKAVAGTRAGVPGGIIRVSGRSQTFSRGTSSLSVEVTASRTRTRRTTQVIIHTKSPSRTDEITETKTFSLTKSALVTPSKMTITVSGSASQEKSKTKSFSETLIPGKRRLPVSIAMANDGIVSGDAIRGFIDDQGGTLRTAYVKITNNFFRGGSQGFELAPFIKLTPQLDTFYGFSALSSVMITDNSFSANSTHLMITFNLTDQYDVANDEVIFLNVDIATTYMSELDLPRVFPQLKIVISHINDATAFADVAITFASFVAVLGSPSAFKDQQSLALIGAMKCARGAQRTVFRAADRIISPLYFGSYLWSQWIGVFIPSYGFLWLHTALLLFKMRDVKRLKPGKVLRRAAAIFYPSISLFVAQMLHLGVIFYSIEFIQNATDSPGFIAMACWSLLYAFTVTCLIGFWSVVDRSLTFVDYTKAEFSNVPWYLEPIVPFGHWAPDSATRLTRWAIGDYRRKAYASFEYFVGWFVAASAAYQTENVDNCVTQYAVMGSFFVLCILLIVILRPFRSHWANGAAALSNAGLCAIMMCATAIVHDPFGAAHTATNTVRWMMTVLIGLRGLVGMLVFYLEWKLVDTRVAHFKKEAARIQRQSAIQDILTAKIEKKAARAIKDASKSKNDSLNDPLLSSPSAGKKKLQKDFDDSGDDSPPVNPLVLADTTTASVLPPSQLRDDDDHTVLASILHVSGNTSIFNPIAEGELARRQRLQRLLDDSPHPSAGTIARRGPNVLPTWL